MANETTIDAETARRLLLILSLEGKAKGEEVEWALSIIHQIPGYAGITQEQAVRDDFLREVLVAIAAEQLSSTTPIELPTLIEDAKKREAALKTAKEAGEKKAEEFIEAAEKAAKTKAQIKVPQVAPEAPASVPETPAPTQPVSEGFSIRVSPRFIEKLGKKAVFAPFTVTRFLSPGLLQENPAVATSLATSIPLSELSKKAEGLPEAERVKILRFVEAINKARYSIVARMQLPMKIASIRGVQATFMESSEMGLPQGQFSAIIQTAKVSAPSLLGGLGRQVLGGIAQSAISKGVTKLATKAITTALGTAVAPGVGTAISLAVGWLVDKGKDLLSWITRNAPKVAIGIGVFLFGTGFILQSNILMAGGVGVGFGGFIGQSGGFGPALSKAGGVASSVIGGITSLTVASIATPLIVALISIPVLVAIILFIINSGAYLVPPAELALSESPYILVEKIANPEGPFQNGKVPEITYTITIIPLRGSLANIAFEYDCEVIKEGVAPNCPKVTLVGPDGKEVSVGKQGGLIISPTEPYKITYSTTYGGASFNDSAIIDTFTVTADSPEQKGAQASGSAVVIIGNPPTECFVFASGESDPKGRKSVDWGTDAKGRANILGAIGQLARAPAYMTPLCVEGGPIYLYRVPVDYGGGWASIKNGGSIFLYNSGVSSYGTAVYTLAHETGHLTNWRRPPTFDSFRSQGISVKEGYLHTYPNQKDIYEDFAETIGLYVGEPFYHPTKWGDFSYENKYPLHYNFAKTLFGGVEY